MRLPEIQDELRKLADVHGIPRLAELASYMARRKPKIVAPARSRPITPSLAIMIRLFAKDNPTMSQVEIGRVFNVNPGRVSEAIRGKRR